MEVHLIWARAGLSEMDGADALALLGWLLLPFAVGLLALLPMIGLSWLLSLGRYGAGPFAKAVGWALVLLCGAGAGWLGAVLSSPSGTGETGPWAPIGGLLGIVVFALVVRVILRPADGSVDSLA